MLHIGCHLSISKGLTSAINDAVSINADTFAFFTRNPRGGSFKLFEEEDINSFYKIYNSNKFVKLVAHAPYTMNLCSKDESIRNFSRQAIKNDIKKMEMIPDNYYNFHPGSHTGQGVEVAIKQIAKALNEAIKENMTTTILLETMSGKGSEVGSKFEELSSIIKQVDINEKVGVCLDTCHVSDAGYDIINNLDKVLDEFDSIIGIDRLKAIHINDSKNPPFSHKDRHAPIGEGFLGIDTFKSVVNNKYLKNLPFILETPHDDIKEYKREIELLRSL